MVRFTKVATCALNQWSMDFEGNSKRIKESIAIAKKEGAKLRVGPELEVCGYSCCDHFFELDTITHCWEIIADILRSDLTDGILCIIGMPIMHRLSRFNCAIAILNRKIILIRPKLNLADDGNYWESRYFVAWTRDKYVEEFVLPKEIVKANGQRTCTIGDAVLQFNDATVGIEICEELFTVIPKNSYLALENIEIVVNTSASHHEIGKVDLKDNYISQNTKKSGGLYLYSNFSGCDGQRIYFDGRSSIHLNGDLLAHTEQFSVHEVELAFAIVDLDEIISYRKQQSNATFSERMTHHPSIYVDFDFAVSSRKKTLSIIRNFPQRAQEIAYGPACWLWDYLRRSGAAGFFLPLSGGIDSCSSALIVYSMCTILFKEVTKGNSSVLDDIRKVLRDKEFEPEDAKHLCNRILHTAYMGTENSGSATKLRAKELTNSIGSYHIDFTFDATVESMKKIFSICTGKFLRFKIFGGSHTESIALQNLQARLRMVFSYLFALTLPWVRSYDGFLLVLGSANVDESLRGYFTKYDCSSADLNPIGGISKTDLKLFVEWCRTNYNFEILKQFIEATPTAELEPITDTYCQSDEQDMQMTYKQLSLYGTLRKVYSCGPVEMFHKLQDFWRNEMSPLDAAENVKKFFRYYSINRHKMTTLPPSYHAEAYSPDDNRYDPRPFLYPDWKYQFSKIDEEATSFVE